MQKNLSNVSTQSHIRLACYSVDRKAKQRSSVDYGCSGNLWNSSNSTGRLKGRAICVCIHLVCTFVWQRMRIMPMGVFGGWSWSPPHSHTHTHTNSATQPSVLHPCPWPSPCTWLIPLYSTLCIKVHFRKVSKGVVQAGIEQPPPLLLRSFCGLKASFLLVSSH